MPKQLLKLCFLFLSWNKKMNKFIFHGMIIASILKLNNAKCKNNFISCFSMLLFVDFIKKLFLARKLNDKTRAVF